MFAQLQNNAFLWQGTGIDEVDDAIMDLVKIAEVDEDAAKELADLISSVKSKVSEIKEKE